jgi:hypothetical protein
VGAYVTKKCFENSFLNQICDDPLTVGDIAPFSSVGPRRDGMLKPDVCAPGAIILATLSDTSEVIGSVDRTMIGVTDFHIAGEGTTLASAHVAGAVALLLSYSGWSTAYPYQVKARIQSTATRDSFTGPQPNATWGAGKLNAGAMLDTKLSVRIIKTSNAGEALTIQASAPTFSADSVSFDLFPDGCFIESNPRHLGTIGRLLAGNVATFTYAYPDTSPDARVRVTAYETAASEGAPTTVVQAVSDSFGVSEAIPAAVGESTPPTRFSLDQNIPNPFNPVTSIRFAIAQPGPAALRIFAIDGRLVRTLVNRYMKVGHYQVTWDGVDEVGRPVASGIYLLEAKSGGKHLVRKVTALK